MPGEYARTGKKCMEEASVHSQGAANRGKKRDNLFLNNTIPLWNDLKFKVKDAKS